LLRYRTEIFVPADRYICLQLPVDLPEGLATVTVHVHEATASDDPGAHEAPDPDREDIEWWEEFEDTTDQLV
jgi:hypothetical protein